MGEYFTHIAKNKNSLKILKEKNKKLIQRSKNIKESVNKYFKKFTLKTNDEETKNNNSEMKYPLYKNLNNRLRIISLISSDLFYKLYLKIMYKFESNFKDEDLYDIFSFWFYLKNMKNIIQDSESNSTQENLELINVSLCENPNNSENKIIDSLILKNISSYCSHLFEKSKSKNMKETNEEEIFTKDFYNLYTIFLKLEKIKIIKHIKENFQNVRKIIIENKALSKEELYYIKNIYSILQNNGQHSFQITKN